MPFFVPVNDIQKDTTLLDQYLNGAHKVAFNHQDPAHTALLERSSRTVNQKLLALQSIDKKLTIALAVGTSAFVLSWIFPFASLATVALMYAGYQMGLRQNTYKEYTEALCNLGSCCQWSLGQAGEEAIITAPAISVMLNTLTPLTNETQLSTCIHADYQQAIAERQAQQRAQGAEFLGEPLDKKHSALYFKIYGYEQGGVLAILEAIALAIKSGFNAVKNSFSNSENAPAPHPAAP